MTLLSLSGHHSPRAGAHGHASREHSKELGSANSIGDYSDRSSSGGGSRECRSTSKLSLRALLGCISPRADELDDMDEDFGFSSIASNAGRLASGKSPRHGSTAQAAAEGALQRWALQLCGRACPPCMHSACACLLVIHCSWGCRTHTPPTH